MVLRVDLIADIYLTSSIPMVPFRTTWKLHMSFIEKSCNCFLSKRNFFFFFHFLWTFVHITWSFLPFPRIFLFFHGDSRFDLLLLKNIFLFYTFKIFSFIQNFFLKKFSSTCEFYNLCFLYMYLPTSFELLLLYIFNSQKNPQAFPLYFKKKSVANNIKYWDAIGI